MSVQDKGWASRWLQEHSAEGRLSGSHDRSLTKAQLADLTRRVERSEPTRARAVLAYLDLMEKPVERNRQDRRRAGRHRSKAKAKQRRKRWIEPDEQEQHIRELNRLMRKELERAPDEDGEVAGPLAVVAQYATPHLLKDFGLDESHGPPLQHWLMAKFGDVLRCQRDIDASIEGYLAWREACLQLAAEGSA